MALNKLSTTGYQTARRLHFWSGLLSALVVVLLTVTGVLLNHSQELGLDRRFVQSELLLRWYGVEMPASMRRFVVGSTVLIQAEEQVFLAGQPIAGLEAPLVGAVEIADSMVLASGSRLILLSLAGELIEQVALPGVTTIDGIGLAPGGHLVIGHDDKSQEYDLDAMAWAEVEAAEVGWSVPQLIPAAAQPDILSRIRGGKLSWERLLQELHSGRLFGPPGVWLVDLVAVVLLLQVITGLLLWRQTNPNR